MKHIALALVLLSLATILITSCTPLNAQEAKSYDHVIILGLDGWGASSFQKADMPFLKNKIPNSAWTIHKRSVLPTSSASNWASMFKGVGPEAHGFNANIQSPAFDIAFADKKGNFPSLFSLYREVFPEREMGYLYQWDGMRYLFDMDDFNYTQQFPISSAGSSNMAEKASQYIISKTPAILALFWDFPDNIGHNYGWYSDEYMNVLKLLDSYVQSIYDACDKAGILGSTLFVITSDHGGHDKTHGSPVMSDLETPFILIGKDIVPGEIEYPVLQYDVAAIIADYLHLTIPQAWRGRPIRSIYIRR